MQYWHVIEESNTYTFRPFYYECVDFLSIENEFITFLLYNVYYLNILIIFFSYKILTYI